MEILEFIKEWQTLIAILLVSVIVPGLTFFLKERRDDKKKLFYLIKILIKNINESYQCIENLDKSIKNLEDISKSLKNRESEFLFSSNIVFIKISSQERLDKSLLSSIYLVDSLDKLSIDMSKINCSFTDIVKFFEKTIDDHYRDWQVLINSDNFKATDKSCQNEKMKKYNVNTVKNLEGLIENIREIKKHLELFIKANVRVKVVARFFHKNNWYNRWMLESTKFKFKSKEQCKKYWENNCKKIDERFKNEVEKKIKNYEKDFRLYKSKKKANYVKNAEDVEVVDNKKEKKDGKEEK